MKPTSILLSFLYVWLVCTGCVMPIPTVVTKEDVNTLPVGGYEGIAWFSPNEIAFSYVDSSDALALEEYQIVIEQLDTHEREIVKVPMLEQCTVTWLLEVRSTLNESFAITRRCTFWTEHVSERFTDILAYDAESATFSEVTRSPLREDVVSFSFLPDMSASLQTYDSSGGMVGRVVWVDETGAVTPLFEEFSRTRDATFSPTGEAFAFLGTEHLPKVDGGLFGWQLAYQEQLAHPWTLYVMETKEAEPQALVEKIRFGRNSRWSPAGPYIAFSGEVQAFDGVWIVHLETGNLYRVWRESVLFDWSPDGKQMVILDATPTHGQVDPEPRLVVLTLSLPE